MAVVSGGEHRPKPGALGADARSDLLLALTALPVRDLETYLQAMSATITQALGVDTAGVLVLDEHGDSLVAPATAPPGGMEPSAPIHVPLASQSPLAAVFCSGLPYRIADVRGEPALADALGDASIRASGGAVPGGR